MQIFTVAISTIIRQVYIVIVRRNSWLASKPDRYICSSASKSKYVIKAVAIAAKQFRLGNSIEPNFYRYLNLCLAEFLLENNAEAEEAIRHAEQLIDASITTRGTSRVAYAYSRLGLSKDAQRVFNLVEARVAKGNFISGEIRALSYLAIGEIEKAYIALSMKQKEGITFLKEIKANSLHNPVLEEPRFIELRKLMGS